MIREPAGKQSINQGGMKMFGLFESLFGGSGKGPFDDMESEEATAFFVNVIDGDEDEDFYDDDDDEDDLFFD